MMEVMVTIGGNACKAAVNLSPNKEPINAELFTDRMPFVSPNQLCKYRKHKQRSDRP